jgi:DNA primase
LIPDETIERVQQAADIVQIVGEHVKLKRVGNSYRGPCPFHHGKDANFSVVPGKGYKCFVCGESGTVFTFLQKHLGMDFVSAVKLVGEKSGIEVVDVQARREGPDPREPLWEVNAAAAEYFRRVLWEGDAGAPAREYLAKRRVSRETADRFGLGFAPRDPAAMRAHLQTLGYDDARQLAAGLLVRNEGDTDARPRFRTRLMFPILDAGGRYVGFGGRLIDPRAPTELPKYLNSAESTVFVKGRLLYGLSWAKQSIRREDRALLVEGYFDALRLVAAGIEAVVAPLGTALTADQAALLTRYTKNVFLLYDSDKAGLRATFRAGDELLRHGASVRVVTLPEGEDPDTFVDAHGPAALEAQLGAAIDLFERKIQLLQRAGWMTDLHRKRRAVDRLLPTLRAAVDPVTRELYASWASEATGIDRAVLLREVEGEARAAAAGQGAAGRVAERSGADRRQRQERRGAEGEPTARVERELIRGMLLQRGQVEVVAERYGPDAFRDANAREIFGVLLQMAPEASVEELASVLSEGSARVMQDLLGEPGAVVDAVRTVEHGLVKLRLREIRERQVEIRRLIALASDGEMNELLLEQKRLQEERMALTTSGLR